MAPISKKIAQEKVREAVCLFERDFSIDWIIELSGQRPSLVLEIFEQAMEDGWLAPKGAGTYALADPKIRDHVLAGMGPGQKEKRFRSAAMLFLKECRENDLDASRLAPFLLRIPNDEQGCAGLLLAGDAFVKKFQPDKALECYKKLKDDLLRLEGPAIDDLFVRMALKTSKVSTARQSTDETAAVLRDALVRAEKRGDKASQALIRMHIAKNEWLLNRYDSAYEIFKDGWALARQCNEPWLMRSALAFRTFFLFWQGRFNEVAALYETAVSDVEARPEGGFPLLVTITAGQCYTFTGQITQGLGMLDAIQKSCLEAGDLHTAAFATGSIHNALHSIKSTAETLEYIEANHAALKQSGNSYIEMLADGFLAHLYYLKGDIRRSVAALRRFVLKCREVNVDALHHKPHLLELCWAMEQGKYPRMLNLSLDREIQSILVGRNVFLKGLAYRYTALLQAYNKEPEEAIRRSLGQSLKWLEESGHELEILRTRMEIIRRLLLQGEAEAAQGMADRLSGVLEQYHEETIPPDLKPLFRTRASAQRLLSGIYSLGNDMASVQDGKELLHSILSTVNQLTGAERGAIFVANEDPHGPPMKLRASRNLTADQVERPAFEPSMRLIQQAASLGVDKKSFIRKESAPPEEWSAGSSEAARSSICAPIIFKGKTLGVLYHDNRLLNSAFKESDFELLSFFAAQAAAALDNANAQEEIERLKRAMAQGGRIQSRPSFSRENYKEVIGKSQAVRKMLHLIEQVAKTGSNVLILGETGVGKELAANAVHYHSKRRGKAFVKANCSALTETLINSELFGHEKGAFTGASSRRIGRFELADKGTIFLDEIGDLPLDVQANLLRVLQSSEFERVGGNETIRSDFRLIAATNRDLERLAADKKFRQDLYYRLNVFPILVPPLRDRKEDIPLLAEQFIRGFAQKMQIEVKKISREEMNKLLKYHWPGNIRELANVIERGMILSSGPLFTAPDLEGQTDGHSLHRPHSLEENERSHILWALEQKNWKVRGPGGVAEFLDINPSTLAARMKKLGIKRP
ncbi:transcriptional regulator, NifA subfamily, Fis Family [Desulfatibacillum aliphaticivorans]|uniref:Transcriptional regulator, NifA subfamily, Fis Family n=1 Tax=Desulfatibacillum aliphaticivorans TaxID=218208 RepID=B8FB78_DESAL|nr:sigma 54-interacting transcriptional regulator [Desulfatibacillum aliphaticivorans]ACL04522.1 transcriptional regulator, NifA subfamily, Fis Family [Desulfatibacillum aliphaticivorans]